MKNVKISIEVDGEKHNKSFKISSMITLLKPRIVKNEIKKFVDGVL